MSNDSGWHEAIRQVLEEERHQAGEPPTAEEVEAFVAGTLSPAEMERVRALLVHYPMMFRAATAPFPDEEAAPLRHPRNWAPAFAAAAALAIIFGAITLYLQDKVRHLENAEVRINVAERTLFPEGERGSGERPNAITTTADSYLLAPILVGESHAGDYRLDIVDAGDAAHRVIWTGTGLHRDDDGAFRIWVPSRVMPAGTYRLLLYGGSHAKPLATYRVRITSAH